MSVLEKKIAVLGAGGVGGYLAGMLGKTFPHLSLGVRGARMESIRTHGLLLHSDYHGEIRVRPETAAPISELGPQDMIFVCVKNYSLEEVCREMAGAVREDTIVVPVMNGVDCGDRVRACLGKGIVVDALIYIVAFAGADYSITQQGQFANLRVGTRNGDETVRRAVEEVSAVLTAAGIDHSVPENIELEIWRKYILNCAYNVETAFYDCTIGPLRSDPQRAKEYEALVDEAWRVARAKGVPVLPEHRTEMIDRFYHEYRDDAGSSLQRDMHAGRPAEVETFSGYIVREAERLGVEAPVSRRMYEVLRTRTTQGG